MLALYFENKSFTHIMAMRQGLASKRRKRYEMPASARMVTYTDEFRWIFAPSLQDWINDNCAADVILRYDPKSQSLIIAADDETDLTLIATAF